jgi:hypothetical protein
VRARSSGSAGGGEGGYETGATPFGSNAATVLADRGIRLLNEVAGKE